MQILERIGKNFAPFSISVLKLRTDLVVSVLKIRTTYQDLIYCETYQSSKAMRALKKIAPEKELIDQQKNRLLKKKKNQFD